MRTVKSDHEPPNFRGEHTNKNWNYNLVNPCLNISLSLSVMRKHLYTKISTAILVFIYPFDYLPILAVWLGIFIFVFSFLHGWYMGVEPKIGVKPPKWMVKIMENPIKHGMIWGFSIIFGSTPICPFQRKSMHMISEQTPLDALPIDSLSRTGWGWDMRHAWNHVASFIQQSWLVNHWFPLIRPY